MNKWVILSLFCLLGNYSANAQLTFSPYNQELIKKAKTEGKLIFYEFTALWCGHSVMMKETIYSKKEVGQHYNDNFICIQVDLINDPNNIANKFNVEELPHFVFAEADGSVIYSQSGNKNHEEFIELSTIPLAYQNGKTNPMQDFIIATEKEPTKAEDIFQDFLSGDLWKSKEAVNYIFDIATNFDVQDLDRKVIANTHFDQNLSKCIDLVGQGKIDSLYAHRVLYAMLDEMQESIFTFKEIDWMKAEETLKQKLGTRYLAHFYELKATYFFYVDLPKSVNYSITAMNEFLKQKPSKNVKADYYFKIAKKIINDEYDYEGDLSEKEEMHIYNSIYPLLKKAEELYDKPSLELYERISFVCYVLERYDEEKKYKALAKKAAH